MSDSPKWVSCNQAKIMQQAQIARYGGSSGIRDESLLMSALASPCNHWYYGEPQPSLIQLAATYAFALTRNHPFVDGNKRTSCAVCFLFLADNGVTIRAAGNEKERVFLALAAGQMSEQEFADWLAVHAHQRCD